MLRGPEDFAGAISRLGLPLIVKPATQGSSVGMSKVERAEDLPAAWQAAVGLEPVVFAEPWITGAEYTVAILKGRALPSIRIETPKVPTTTSEVLPQRHAVLRPSGLAPDAKTRLGAPPSRPSMLWRWRPGR